ncbi:MAG: hypothetical protein JSU96_06915 [Acidobacteriota bacterium]|nr:MAG: hypothetical protein JSU96_06915 [Acidobacteriota bacterium]
MIVLSLFLLLAGVVAEPASELLFREDWAVSPPEIPLGQNHVANEDLLVELHGPGLHGIKKSHHDWIENDPYYVWSGACPGNWLVSLRHKSKSLDLSQGAKVRWRSKQAGFRQLRIALKLTDGTWLVSSLSAGESKDWEIQEFELDQARWRKLNISRVTEEDWVEKPGLESVAEVGFTDLMPGGLSAACSRLDWIEVHGRWAD